MEKIIASSSKGNAFIYGNIMIDLGVSYKVIKNEILSNNIKVILITHSHGDHMLVSTIKKITEDFPNIIIFGNKEVVSLAKIQGIKINELKLNEFIEVRYLNLGNKDKLELFYDEVIFRIYPLNIYHDAQNFGFLIKEVRFWQENEYIFYATDTHSVEGIKIPKCKKIFLECNYEQKKLQEVRDYLNQNNLFDYTQRTEDTHLSLEKWCDFMLENLTEKGVGYAMHMSNNTNILDKIDYEKVEIEKLKEKYGK